MLTKLKEFQIALIGLFLAFGMVSCAMIVADNISKDNISVTGSAYEIVRSDNASWSFSVNVRSASKVLGYKELKNAQPRIFKYLMDKGIKESQIDVMPSNSYATHRMTPNGISSNEIAYYNFNQTYKINSVDVELIKKLSTKKRTNQLARFIHSYSTVYGNNAICLALLIAIVNSL